MERSATISSRVSVIGMPARSLAHSSMEKLLKGESSGRLI
jgi:hypothetical protein